MSMIVKAQGPRGRAKIHSDGPNHALGLAQYLRTIGYDAWIEDTSGNDIDDKALKNAIRSHHEDTPPPDTARRRPASGVTRGMTRTVRRGYKMASAVTPRRTADLRSVVL